MSNLETPRTPDPAVSPALMMGAVSPLWAYFNAAAAGGLAYWWMTRWTRPMNLEARFAAASTQGVVADVNEVLADAPELSPEAASPVIEALDQPEPEAALAAVAEPAVEAVADLEPSQVPDAIVESVPEVAPVSAATVEMTSAVKPRARKTAPSTPPTEA